jgi:hypothetical protein
MANGADSADSATHVKLRRIPVATIVCSGPTPKVRSRSREGPFTALSTHSRPSRRESQMRRFRPFIRPTVGCRVAPVLGSQASILLDPSIAGNHARFHSFLAARKNRGGSGSLARRSIQTLRQFGHVERGAR